MRIVIAGVPFSPNLGDGLIAMIVSDVLRHQNDEIEISTIDLAGRTGLELNPDFGGGSATRAAMLRLHRSGPTSILDWAYCQAKSRTGRGTVSAWTEILHGADALVIGPGQLLSSRTANFPAKLALLADALDACDDRPPVKLLGVGADASGSRSARRALARAVERLDVQAAVFRDERSVAQLTSLLPIASDRIRIAPDVAVCSTDGSVESDPAPDLTDAIYVDAVDLSTYDDVAGEEGGHDAYRRAISTLLLETGARKVAIGSNGLMEDQATAGKLAAACSDLAPSVYVVHSPTHPAEIVARAEESCGTVGVRLHAVLPALAVGRPVITPILSKKAEMVIARAYGRQPVASEVILASDESRQGAVSEIEEAVQWLTAA